MARGILNETKEEGNEEVGEPHSERTKKKQNIKRRTAIAIPIRLLVCFSYPKISLISVSAASTVLSERYIQI
jgi:hypothetical protein